jgi:mono/diheme cytochrome c family protein
MQRGLAPDGRHLYPAFPYTSYARMQPQDVLDLWAYLLSLPPVDSEVAQHELRFPFMLRRGIGLWKRLHLDPAPVVALAGDDPQLERGRYLVEGAGHCGECHTPRDLTQGLRLDRWLAGAANPEGEGRVPDLSPHADGLGDWSAADIEYYLESGVDPDYDVVGGSMVAVQENMARLPAADRAAIAAYLKALPTL